MGTEINTGRAGEEQQQFTRSINKLLVYTFSHMHREGTPHIYGVSQTTTG
jgi:hypothetical protein